MIDLYIDNKRIDIDQENTNVSISLSIGSVEDPAKSLTAFSKSFDIPASANNKQILQFADEVYSVEQFNNALHTARVEVDGVVVMEGTAQITQVSVNHLLNTTYEVNLIGAEFEWAKQAADTPLNETQGLDKWTFTAETVKNLLENDSGVYLFPVYRGKYVRRINDEKFVPRPYTVLADYLPFFNIRKLTETIIGSYGYTVRSNFFTQNELFNRLVVAGEWKSVDASELEEKYDFEAGKFALGSNYFTISNKQYELGFNDIGRIVDTVNPKEESVDEEILDDVYDNGGSITFPENGEPFFTAKEDIVLALEYNISYVTGVGHEYGAAGENYGKLIWFDRINGEAVPEDCIEVDKTDVTKATPQGEYEYIYRVTKGVVNDKTYIRFRHNKDGLYDEEGEYDETYIKISRSGAFVCSLSYECTAEVWYRFYNLNSFPPGWDWKRANVNIEMYVLDTEDPTIEVKYISEPKFLRAGETLTISTPIFSCSNAPDMADEKLVYIQLGITNNTTVKAVFYKLPGWGSELSAKNMLQAGIKQIDFINAVKQMFDLMFYTNPATKEVFIEPRKDFYTNTLVDWRSRMDYSQEITIEDAGTDIGKTILLGYQTDDVIDRTNENTGTELGTYKEDILKYYAEETEDLTNPQFVATTLVGGSQQEKKEDDNIGKNEIPGAEAISLIDLSAEDDENSDPWELEMNSSMKVCEYLGMTALPEGQHLIIRDKGTDLQLNAYPKVSFENLHFETENGLKAYYTGLIDTYNYGKRITAMIKLSPVEVENLMLPNEQKKDFRAKFLININGEDVLCRLEEVNDYDPTSNEATECVFVKQN